ncbi:MAG: iron ABC transporter ATP-binding protein [Candidatus Cloacimonetes bacterium 4572_55]|nr:MAG: iron ABC transporter ATP-binding protein [Candidatus Cloacimonetes bacterium 4572_55]
MIVKMDHIFKSYDKIPAVNGISLHIEKGERVVILGPSGCGKTTLLRMIAGFVSPDKGTIEIDGLVVAKNGRSLVEPENRKIGMVFQDLALWPHKSVHGNLEFGLRAKKIPKNERNKRIDEMLVKTQMIPFKNNFPGELSGGQQQRIALARALIMEPKILLMDEPLSNLDIDLNLLLRKEVLELQEELGITMLYVTHDRDEAFSLATRVVVMQHGNIQKIGNADEVTKFLSELPVNKKT